MENNNINNNNEQGHDQDVVASTSGTADRRSSFPAGYRFVPTDDELITHYLAKKVKNEPLPVADMYEVKLYSHPPHELAEKYTQLGDKEWYFFTLRDRKYPNGERPSRSVGDIGYWKATGAEKPIKSKENVQIGNKTSLVFYFGKAKSGDEKKTNWIMHEYKLHTPKSHDQSSVKKFDGYALCKIYEKPERLNKKQKVVDDDDEQEVNEDIPASLHIPDNNNNNNNNNINGMDQNHEQLPMMTNNNGYVESNSHFQPQNREHVAINGYGDNSHQSEPQHYQHGPINGYRDHTDHQFQTQNHGYVQMNCNRDQTQCGYNQQQVDIQNVYRGHNRNSFLEDLHNINSYSAIFDEGPRANFDDGTTITHDDFFTAEWLHQPLVGIHLGGDVNIFLQDHHNYQGHNGNNVEQDPHQGHNGNNVEQDPYNYQGYNGNNGEQDLHNYQGYNGNNVEQDPSGINSNFGVDEGRLRANPDDGATERRHQQQGSNNFEQDTDDIIRSKSES